MAIMRISSKKNTVIYFRDVENKLYIANPFDTEENGVQSFPVDGDLVARGEFQEAFSEALASYEMPERKISAELILSPRFYGTDYITVPMMKRFQMGEALKTEMKTFYKNYTDLEFQTSEIHTGKTSVTFVVTFIQKSILASLKEVFEHKNIIVEHLIPYASALASFVLKDAGKKKSTALLFHTENGFSYMGAFGKETFLGGMPVFFGTEALSDSKISSERLLYYPDSAELLVINTKERAKAKKLTVAINIEDETIDDSILDDEDEKLKNPEADDISRRGNEMAENREFPEEEESEELSEEKIKTLRKSAVRNLPKFMQRELPITRSGYILENFRIFERRILLAIKEMKWNENLPDIEAVLLSMPPEYSFIADAMEAEHPEYKWSFVPYVEEEGHFVIEETNVSSMGKLPVFE